MKSAFVQHTVVVTQRARSVLGALKPLGDTTEFGNEQLPSVAGREQNRGLCSHSNPPVGRGEVNFRVLELF